MSCRWLQSETPAYGDAAAVAPHQQRLLDLQNLLEVVAIPALRRQLPEADVVVWVASLPPNHWNHRGET